MLRHIEVYSGITEAYGAIIRHTWNSALHLHVQLYDIQNPGLFRTLGIFKSLSNM